ncbi:hypothetical protein BBJ28_00016821 [Nothophytophthora sp. Chile5]|nr:hypothetical protein BBJ28_00016821 [Nothophytophthora sp. Chile5]
MLGVRRTVESTQPTCCLISQEAEARVPAAAMRERSMQRETNQASRTRTFWQKFPEVRLPALGKEELNQYWYSADTVATLASEAIAETPQDGGRIAFLSTPSVYFAVKSQQSDALHQRECVLFDVRLITSGLSWSPRSEGDQFVPFDFHKPDDIPPELLGAFDFVVVDPPFITREVWELYATAIKLLLRSTGSKILLTTIEENEAMMRELLGCRVQTFKPAIPHLVYQYALFANYESTPLGSANPEVPTD